MNVRTAFLAKVSLIFKAALQADISFIEPHETPSRLIR
jgi:hypothetical protein